MLSDIFLSFFFFANNIRRRAHNTLGVQSRPTPFTFRPSRGGSPLNGAGSSRRTRLDTRLGKLEGTVLWALFHEQTTQSRRGTTGGIQQEAQAADLDLGSVRYIRVCAYAKNTVLLPRGLPSPQLDVTFFVQRIVQRPSTICRAQFIGQRFSSDGTVSFSRV